MPPTINTRQDQQQVSAMMCEASSSSDVVIKQADGQTLIASAFANVSKNHQCATVVPLPSSSLSSANNAHAQYVQALQLQQHQQLQQLQQHMQQAAQSLQYSPETQLQQQQLLMAQIINNANQAPNQAAAALQTALLLQQHQQHHEPQQQIQQLKNAAIQYMTMTHHLIPTHFQSTCLAASLNGTPGYQPSVILPPNTSTCSNNNGTTNAAASSNTANTTSHHIANLNQQQHLIPLAAAAIVAATNQPPGLNTIPLTVQEDMLRNSFPPIYNGVNLQYPGLRQVHASPPVYCVDNFLTPSECQFLMQAASDVFQPAPVVGQGFGEISASRTSSTCYLAREDLPEYMRKVRLLTGKPICHCELPQVGRYFPSQRYLQHFDAFDLSDGNGRRFASNGGQRVVTVLVYLNTLTEDQGGATHFPNLNMKVQPKQGMALVFFPSTVDGLLDRQALHAALPPTKDATKYVSQVWVRQSEYRGDPSKRLNPIMGIQNYQPPSVMDVLQFKAAAGASLT